MIRYIVLLLLYLLNFQYKTFFFFRGVPQILLHLTICNEFVISILLKLLGFVCLTVSLSHIFTAVRSNLSIKSQLNAEWLRTFA